MSKYRRELGKFSLAKKIEEFAQGPWQYKIIDLNGNHGIIGAMTDDLCRMFAEALARHTNDLKALSLRNLDITDRGAKMICKALLERAKIIEGEGAKLRYLRLKSLDLSGNQLTDDSIEIISSLAPHVRNIELKNNNFTCKAVKFKGPAFSYLESMGLDGNFISEEKLKTITYFPCFDDIISCAHQRTGSPVEEATETILAGESTIE